MKYFRATMEAMQQFSPDARVFCLLHKMDLVSEDTGDKVCFLNYFNLFILFYFILIFTFFLI